MAWRSLLRLHHPDVAGPSGLERAKRINVAHDWLSDPDLRMRYDHERGLRTSVRETGGRHPRTAGRSEAATDGRAVRRPPRPRSADPAEALERFLDQVAVLTPDEVDRLACAVPAPIAFGATIARFLPEDRLAAIEAMEIAVAARLDPAAAARPGVRDAIEDYATELVLGTFLDDLLERAVPRPRPRAPDARLGCRRRPAALWPERRRGSRADRPSSGTRWRRGRGTRGHGTPCGVRRRSGRRPLAARCLARRRRGPARLIHPGRTRCRRRGPERGRSHDHGPGPLGGRAPGPPARAPPRLRAAGLRLADAAMAPALPARRPAVAARRTPRPAMNIIPGAYAMLVRWRRGWSRSEPSWGLSSSSWSPAGSETRWRGSAPSPASGRAATR